jgi:hypothetical protein
MPHVLCCERSSVEPGGMPLLQKEPDPTLGAFAIQVRRPVLVTKFGDLEERPRRFVPLIFATARRCGKKVEVDRASISQPRMPRPNQI